MIAVIADDLTGAAELGGVGLRYGLDVEVQTELNCRSKADLLVIDTNSRSVSSLEAAEKITTVAERLQQMNVNWIYKKIDSVLRGNVLAELQALLKISSKKSVLLVPANPSFGRIISDGKYFIKNKLLHQTDFSQDPEYPIATSDVLKLLGESPDVKTCFLKKDQPVPKGFIAVGEAEIFDDLIKWAWGTHIEIIPAGGAEFFAALLTVMGLSKQLSEINNAPTRGEIALFVCGSASEYSRKMVSEARNQGKSVYDMPLGLFTEDDIGTKLVQQWANEVIKAFDKNNAVIVAISQPVVQNIELSRKLAVYMAILVEIIIKRIKIQELFIEGGATASAIVNQFHWTRFFPLMEFAQGIVRMRVEKKPELYLTIKPGSYPWSKEIWSLI